MDKISNEQGFAQRISFGLLFPVVHAFGRKRLKLVVSFFLIVQGFLVVEWLRIHLAMQGTLVRYLVQEDPTYLRATKPVCHN